jgi:hypothetical protein
MGSQVPKASWKPWPTRTGQPSPKHVECIITTASPIPHAKVVCPTILPHLSSTQYESADNLLLGLTALQKALPNDENLSFTIEDAKDELLIVVGQALQTSNRLQDIGELSERDRRGLTLAVAKSLEIKVDLPHSEKRGYFWEVMSWEFKESSAETTVVFKNIDTDEEARLKLAYAELEDIVPRLMSWVEDGKEEVYIW